MRVFGAELRVAPSQARPRMSSHIRRVGGTVVLMTLLQLLFFQSTASADQYGYVFNSGSNTYSVINLSTNTVIANVPANWVVLPNASTVYFIDPGPAVDQPTLAFNLINGIMYSTVTNGLGSAFAATDVTAVLAALNSGSGGGGGGGGSGETHAGPALPPWAMALLTLALATIVVRRASPIRHTARSRRS